MPGVYDNLGIRFEYPENWTVDEDSSNADRPSITVSSPSSAFWSLTLCSPTEDVAQLARAAVDVLRSEYSDLDAEEASDTVRGCGVHGYDVHFYCLDLTTTALIRGFHTSQAACLLFCQAEDRDFERLAQVFLAMTTSLLGERQR